MREVWLHAESDGLSSQVGRLVRRRVDSCRQPPYPYRLLAQFSLASARYASVHTSSTLGLRGIETDRNGSRFGRVA